MEGPERPHHETVSGFELLHIPYDERWEHLKNIIVAAFLGNNVSGKGLTIPNLEKFMKDNHGFIAVDHQYRTHFKKWGIRKRTTKDEKEAIITALGKRNRSGTSTSDVTILQGGLGKEVDKKQMKRSICDTIRRQRVEPLSPGVFSQWNLPYAAYSASNAREGSHPSPFSHDPATPHYLKINSPKALTPGGHLAECSPVAALVLQKTLQDRTNLLLQGRRDELLGKCNPDDQRQDSTQTRRFDSDSGGRIISGWLHDYWMHSFVTAKFWGRGPQQWTAGLVSELTLGATDSGSPQAFASPAGWISASSPQVFQIPQPTNLCQWVIHCGQDTDSSVASSPCESQAEFELHDQSSWTPWPESETRSRTLQSTMEESFTHSRFSATSIEELPISNQLIAHAVSKSPDQLALDSIAFAIMAGNHNSVTTTMESIGQFDIGSIEPYHLAASFLDGGHSCCVVLIELIDQLEYRHPIALNNVNSDGHTVLDSLMISILRSHTNLAPAEASTSFNHCNRFPGEEKDICGRWDADSPVIRHLHKAGYPRIPHQWKHSFCHSAVQAVCHSMLAIFVPPSSPKINTLSGLFRRRCTNCGLEMKLGPLHVLVVVAFHLANRGMDGETLFGAIACAVCLLALGADVDLRADLAVAELFTFSEDEDCQHRPINAMELAEKIPLSIIDKWEPSCKIGWKCLSLVLRRAGREFRKQLALSTSPRHHMKTSMLLNDYLRGDLEEGDYEQFQDVDAEHFCGLFDDHEHYRLPCMPQLGPLWASIQTEILTYRKINSLDPNISENFQLASLEQWLEGRTSTFQTPLVEDNMMKDHLDCGWFGSFDSFDCEGCFPAASDVSAHYFMNMDVWARATFAQLSRSDFNGFDY